MSGESWTPYSYDPNSLQPYSYNPNSLQTPSHFINPPYHAGVANQTQNYPTPQQYYGAQSAPQLSAQSAPQLSAQSAPQFGAQSAPQLSAQSAPQFGAQSAPQFGAQSAPQFGAQMYGYGTSLITQEQDQQFYVTQSTGQKRKREAPNEGLDGEEMDGYLESVESSMESSNKQSAHIATPAAAAPAEKAMTLQDRLSALAADKTETVETDDPILQSKAAQLGPLPKKAKVVTKQLDPSIFQPARKSRFDQAPSVGKSPFATGANATPVGKTPTVVYNKYSISSSLTTKKKNPDKAGLIGFKRKEDGTIIIPENSCTVDIRIQRAIMQEIVQMIEFKFTIGINKLYKGVVRNQRNKKKGDPLKIEEEITIDDLVTYCEAMPHFVRVKKKKFIKLLPHITPYLRAGVNLWAMFHGRGTRRVIRDNWVQWIGSGSGPVVTPKSFGIDWNFFFQMVRSCYMSCNKRQRSKYRSKFKGLERYIIANTMWAPNKSVKLEKLWKELKCTFAVKKVVQELVDWKKVIYYVIGNIKILVLDKGEFVSFHPKLRDLLAGIEEFVSPHVGKVNFDNMAEFEEKLRAYCLKHGGYDWSEWDLSLRALIKLYNCSGTSIYRPDPFSKKPDTKVAFSKIFRTGFKELVLPVQESRLGVPTVPAMVKREMKRLQRHEEKKAAKTAELKKAAEEKAAEEAREKAAEEKRRLAQKKIREETELPSNEEMMFKITGVEKKETVVVAPAEPQTYDDVVVSDDDEEYFHFDPIYTYCQYLQPVSPDTLYPIPGGTHLEDELKLRVENQPTTPGQGYGLALSGPRHSVLFVFYPFARTMRSSHFTNERHHHRFYGDFRAAALSMFQLTIKIKRNRFEVFTDGLCIKTVPAYMNTVGITSALVTGDSTPFVNFRVRRIAPEVPVLPYLIRTRHQKGLLVSIERHPTHGIITKIGKISGNIQMFVSHLQDVLASSEEPSSKSPPPQISVVGQKCVWVVGHHKTTVKSWLKCIGF